VRRAVRFVVGVGIGALVLGGYLRAVGVGTVVDRLVAVSPSVIAVVFVLVVAEGVADAIGVWASVEPLGDGLSWPESVRFALAGDFFDVLSPAGPVSSEPIMARFFSVATGVGYSDALGVRSTAKYVKSGAQVGCSVVVGAVVLAGSPAVTPILVTLGAAAAGLVILAGLLLRSRTRLSGVLVAVLTPVVVRVSGLYRDRPYGRATVADAVGRYWQRIVAFRETPGLLALVAGGGLLEQALTATALWVALAGVGVDPALLPIVVVVPLPQVASVVPIPGSLGAYDLLLGGALVAVTGAPGAAATAAVLLVRTLTLPFGAVVGGLCVASLRGWRPSAG
jgi:uncharacterized membrane protein YbhN (UPF0104 family)